MSDTIVLGYDGSESANAALAETIRLAPALGANVVVVFAYYISPLGGFQEGTIKEALEKHASHETKRAVADLEAADIPVESQIVSGKPADAILDVAENVAARLIVVGTVGENPISGVVLGSVALKLIQRSRVPLLVVPAHKT